VHVRLAGPMLRGALPPAGSPLSTPFCSALSDSALPCCSSLGAFRPSGSPSARLHRFYFVSSTLFSPLLGCQPRHRLSMTLPVGLSLVSIPLSRASFLPSTSKAHRMGPFQVVGSLKPGHWDAPTDQRPAHPTFSNNILALLMPSLQVHPVALDPGAGRRQVPGTCFHLSQ